jgi:hypothetical protein
MRRTAHCLGLHRITVARKLRFLGGESRRALEAFRSGLSDLPGFQFDELETFEGSKCKPLSVLMAVSADRRKILGIEVASMPAKGPLAPKARALYGPRGDRRAQALTSLFRDLRPSLASLPLLRSDQNPRYPKFVRRFFPHAIHLREPGARGCVVGQGELKALRFDPLFSLNHTFAMLRANVSRLVRRTWCTTKKASALADHLFLYADYHNRILT